MRNSLFSLADPRDVVVFFDFMCVPQEGLGHDGAVIPRTAEEYEVFRECLANMSVLYSMFPVLVCDEVPDGVASYMVSGWCFAELLTASLGGRLSVFSPDYAQTQDFLTLFSASGCDATDLHDGICALDVQLSQKSFRAASDRTVVQSLIRGFLLKRILCEAVRRRELDRLSWVLHETDPSVVAGLLDQPVDDMLNTPLHLAVAQGFTEGALMLVDFGAHGFLKNIRGDTSVQRFGVPICSRAALAVRGARIKRVVQQTFLSSVRTVSGRGCIFGGNFEFSEGGKSVILGVWAARGGL